MIAVVLIVFFGLLAVSILVLVLLRSASLEHESRAQLLRLGAETLAYDVPEGQDPAGGLHGHRRRSRLPGARPLPPGAWKRPTQGPVDHRARVRLRRARARRTHPGRAVHRRTLNGRRH